MSDVEIQQGADAPVDEAQPETPREPAPPIESRFLFVDVAALRAKQLRRGAKARLAEDAPKPIKPERVAMSEVRTGLVDWELPDFKVLFESR